MKIYVKQSLQNSMIEKKYFTVDIKCSNEQNERSKACEIL